MKRLEREQVTVSAMVGIWCRDQHGRRELCPECRALLDYSRERLSRCQFGDAKPTCKKCPVHCYQPQKREAMRIVMRYAGPRMPWRHPILSLLHLFDGKKTRETP